MSGLESVPSAYLSIGFLTVVGIIMPLTNFLITWVVRPKVDPARPHITRSYLLEGYERDHSLYPRRLTTFECNSAHMHTKVWLQCFGHFGRHILE